MHLLSQQKTRTLKNEELRQTTEQGMKMAERVDTLRKTLLEEEKSLTEQRETLLGKLREDAEKLKEEARQAKYEIERARAERKTLEEPLDKEWEQLRSVQASFKNEVIELEHAKAQTASTNKKLQEKIDKADDTIDRYHDLLKESNELLVKRKKSLAEVQTLSKNLSDDVDKFNTYRNDTSRMFDERERRLLIRERELDLKRDALNEREMELKLTYGIKH